MYSIQANIWVGSFEETSKENIQGKFTGLLCVAAENGLNPLWSSPQATYQKAGLVNSPNNSVEAYVSAVLSLHDLICRNRIVLVYCKEGISRAPVIVALYLAVFSKTPLEVALHQVKVKCKTMNPHKALWSPALQQAHIILKSIYTKNKSEVTLGASSGDTSGFTVFAMSGNLGDVIYANPTIRKLGGGHLVLTPDNRTGIPIRTIVTPNWVNQIAPLLMLQPWIKKVSFSETLPTETKYDLNQFRLKRMPRGKLLDPELNLARIMLNYFNVDCDVEDNSFLVNIEPRVLEDTPVIFARSFSYRNDKFPWKAIVARYKGISTFVGTVGEHEDFCSQFGEHPYYATPDLLELAQVIKGCNLFVGNQSGPYAIAEGLKVTSILEASPTPHIRNTIFKRKGALHEIPKNYFENNDTPPVTISIVCFNSLEYTKKCVNSLLIHTHNFKIIFTDNASTDGTTEYLKDLTERFPFMSVITNTKNLGFNVPNNVAFTHCDTDYFVMLNNDVELFSPWVEPMIAAFDREDNLAICGVKGTPCDWNERGEGIMSSRTDPNYVEASCLMIKSNLVHKYGLFSSEYEFAYCEDADLSLRLREKGYNLAHVEVKMIHYGSVTSKKVLGLDVQNNPILLKNHSILKNRWSTYFRREDFKYEVLIIRKEGKGDVLFVSPVVAKIKRNWPNCVITLHTDYPELFQFNHNVDIAIKSRKDTGKFDYVFDLTLSYENNPKCHVIDAYAKTCGLSEISDKTLQLNFSEKEKESLSLTWDTSLSPYAVVHPGPVGWWKGREWEHAKFKEVIQYLLDKGLRVMVVGYDGFNPEFKHATAHFAGGSLVLAALMKEATLFVGIESFPSNVAQSQGVKSVVLFGCIAPEYRLVDPSRSLAVVGRANCTGKHHDHPVPAVSATCDGACMDTITVSMVTQAIDSQLNLK